MRFVKTNKQLENPTSFYPGRILFEGKKNMNEKLDRHFAASLPQTVADPWHHGHQALWGPCFLVFSAAEYRP